MLNHGIKIWLLTMTGSAHVGFIDIASFKFSCLLVWNFFTLYNLKWLHATILLNLSTLTKMLESSFSWLRISQLSRSSNCFSQLKMKIAVEFSLSLAYLIANHNNTRPYNVKGNLCNKCQFCLKKKSVKPTRLVSVGLKHFRPIFDQFGSKRWL